MCIFGTLAKNRKYEPNKKNGGVVPHLKDGRVGAVPIGCGKCMECMREKAREWRIRLSEEIKDYKNGVFVTLTFSDEEIRKLQIDIQRKQIRVKDGIKSRSIDKNGKERVRYKYKVYDKQIQLKGYETDNEIATLAVDRMLERWRKKHKKSVRHWLITELGHEGTENIHLHGIIFTDHKEDIEKMWKYGYVWDGYEEYENYVNGATVTYITKYITKTDIDHKEYKPKVLCSDGIGAGYLKRHDSKTNRFNGKKTQDYYQSENGHRQALPIYYRNKLYSDEQREYLWLMKLDKNVRWIDGVKVKIGQEDGDEDYYKLVKEAQMKNKRLGYGERMDWERKKHEENRRNMLNEKRINRAEARRSGVAYVPSGTSDEGAKAINEGMTGAIGWGSTTDRWDTMRRAGEESENKFGN